MNAIVTNLVPESKLAPADARPDTGPTKPQNTRKRRVRAYLSLARAAVIVGAIGLATVIPLGWSHWVAGLTNQKTDNAALRADITPVSSQIAGFIDTVAVKDYQRVRAGDLLAQIDDSEFRAKLDRAGAAVDAAQAAVRNVTSRVQLQGLLIAQVDAVVLATTADRDKAATEHARQESLTRSGVSTSQRLEDALASIRRLDAQLAEKQAEADAARQQLNVLATQYDQAIADLASRKAELRLAEIEVGRTRIVSPIDGVVNASSVRAGQYVSAGTRIISVVPLPNVYVVANYKETQLSRVRVGQAATIDIDMFPGEALAGRVEQISPASGSEFALLPPDNATGNFTKVAQRIAVKIQLIDIPDHLATLLRPGMSVVSVIHTDRPLD